MDSQFKTKPLAHQLECLQRFGRAPFYANLSEQGTGKTWVAINDMAGLWATGDLNGVLVFAPSGVHYNWTLLEIPKHMPDWVRYRCAAWSASPTKRDKALIDALFNEADPTVLRIFVMNVEALQHDRSAAVARKFAVACPKLMILLDESPAFKNPKAGRTKALFKLKPYSTWRRILSGTSITNGPFDAFSQFNFLDERILGTSSYYAFKAEYAEMLDNNHPLIKNIKRKTGARFTPQIAAVGPNGRPKYRNLRRLSSLIAPHTFRVLKKDCLDLPKKIYKCVWFDMEPEQRRIYDKAADENRLALNGEDTPFNKLVAQMKLMQITTGYYIHPDAREPVRIDCSNPKLTLLRERVAAIVEAGEQIIVWARFRIQIADVVAALRADGISVVEYHGGIKKEDRHENVAMFERHEAQVFVGQQQSGGKGLTLVAATNVFYFSNTYGLDDRIQSEDRAHRIGQGEEVVYTDFCARDSVDLECIEALRSKSEVADEIYKRIAEDTQRGENF